MKADIMPLGNKYYNTKIRIYNNRATHILNVSLPKNGDTDPSDRELELFDINRDEWEKHWDMYCDSIDWSHCERQGTYIEALELLEKINKL